MIILALLIGSFLNVVIYRVPRGKSVVFPPSHCPKCNNQLKWHHLIPVLSFILNRGRCSYCRNKISFQYPLVEILNSILWLFLFLKLGLSLNYLFFSLLSSILLAMSFIDLEHTIIPDGLNLIGIILGLIYKFSFNYTALGNSFLGLIVGGGIFLLIALVTRGAMGGGDIKLMAVLGFWFGWPQILLVIFLSFIIGAIISIVLLILKIKERKDMIPFGPFIALAAYLNLLWGQEMLGLYWNIFLS